MTTLFSGLSRAVLGRRKKRAQPDFIAPMLATLTDTYFSRGDWIYEQKFDGERCLAFKQEGVVRLMSRNRKEMNEGYPELVAVLKKQEADNFIIDGEIVAVSKGLSDFQLLQSRINVRAQSRVVEREKKVPVAYCIFDVMYAGGYDIRDMPLLARKTVLQRLLQYNTILRYSTHRSPNGIAYFKQACQAHWEGIIAKRSESSYVGMRSRDWLKFKCVQEQELVIGGYTEPRGSRTDFGALLVGYYENGTLHYAGKVGTGFDEATLAMLGKKLRALERTTCPFAEYTESTKAVHWVKPQLVAEFKFAEWTKGGKLRVPRYKGLRDDKAAEDVVREVPS